MYLGIDIGTQSLKAIVADDGMRVWGTGSFAYRPDYSAPGWAQQDARVWLAALRPAIAKALAEADVSPDDIRAMAICGQLDGCVGVDRDGQPVAPAIIWMDRRATAETADIDAALVHERAGLVLDATHMAAKIRWQARNLDNAAKVVAWHQPVSFVVEALTGARVIDHSLASTTMLYGLATGSWDDQLLDAFGVDKAALPRPAGAGEVGGLLTRRGAELTGLRRSLPVAVGTGDDFSNPLGCGIGRPGTVSVTIGTGEAVAALSLTPIIDAAMLVETHAYPAGGFHLGNPGWLSGGAVTWFLDTFSVRSAEAFSAMASTVRPGCDGLLFLPALSGAMAPRWIAAARGAFCGATTSHTKAHFARAVLEGTSFAMRDVVDHFGALKVPVERIRIMGGGAASACWTQMRADLMGMPVDALQETDASAMGAVVLAAVAAGDAETVAAACGRLALPLKTVIPIAANRSAYQDAYGRYRELFEALAPTFN